MAEIYKSKSGQEAVERLYRNTLQRWPVPNRQFAVPTRHGDTFVIESGEADATPLVLFHGSGTNSSASHPPSETPTMLAAARPS